MDFTREPIIETVITPREGYRLVVRSSKGAGYEEHFVDALEVVSFGSSIFFRCLERPKPFIVPVSDYEVLEVREPRMILKTPSESHSQKSSGQKQHKEPQQSKQQPLPQPQQEPAMQEQEGQPVQEARPPQEGRGERAGRRDRRQRFRRRRGQRTDEQPRDEQTTEGASVEELVEARIEGDTSDAYRASLIEDESKLPSTAPMLGSILPPPTRLIRDDLELLREKDEYKGAFYVRGEKDDDDDITLQDIGTTADEEMSFREVPFDISEEEIRMSEGGDQEVPHEGPFRPDSFPEEAESNSTQDVQQDKG